MRQAAWLTAIGIVLFWSAAATAEELVHFPSYEDNGPDRSSTILDGYVSRPAAEGRHPAVIFLHGCGGLFMRTRFMHIRLSIEPGELDWAGELTRRGYVVLMVDSFGPRDREEMCSPSGFDMQLYRNRARDAYGALLFLQAQPFVKPDRIGVIGWSQGGGDVLSAIGTLSFARPAQLPQGDFRAAVGFYPTACDERQKPTLWTNAVPLLVLLGAEDVGHPAAPCKLLLDGAGSRGGTVEMQVYPGAYHHSIGPICRVTNCPLAPRVAISR